MQGENQDKLEVEIGASGGKVSLSGDGAARGANALVDALSPFTEGAGALGDMVRSFRVGNAIRTISKAQRLADDLGVVFRPVPPKFLLQWTEAASLEEEGEDDLSDLWASLLVGTSKGFSPTHYLFKRILSEFSRRHVELINALCGEITENLSDQLQSRYKNLNAFIEGPEVPEFTDIEGAEFFKFVSRPNAAGVETVRVKVGKAEGGPFGYMGEILADRFSDDFSQFQNDNTANHLKALGLLNEQSFEKPFFLTTDNTTAHMRVEVFVWSMTSLGVEFFETCLGISQVSSREKDKK